MHTERRLRRISEAEFLRLSEGIPDYEGPHLDRYRELMSRADQAIDSGLRLIQEDDLAVEIRKLRR